MTLGDAVDHAVLARPQRGEVALLKADDAYYRQLDALKAAAQNIQDNDQTRAAIESALRGLAAKKIFKTTYRYKDPIFGTTLYSRTVTVRPAPKFRTA